MGLTYTAKLKAGTSWSGNSLVLHGVPAQAPSAHQPWLYATQSQNTAVQCGLDPATQISATHNFIVIGGERGQWLGGTMANAEHEPITGVWGQSPQRDPGAEPLVRRSGGQGAKPP